MVLKLGILLFLAAVVLTECLLAYTLIPSASAGTTAQESGEKEKPAAREKGHEAKASEKAKGGHEEKGKKEEKHKEKEGGKEKEKHKETDVSHLDPDDQVEVDLGEFTVTASQPSASTTLRIAFHLYGTVAAMDSEEFNSRMKESQHRFREQVIVTLRSAEVSDLADAGLGLLKRKILEKTNSTMGKPLLKMVIFSDFSFVEM